MTTEDSRPAFRRVLGLGSLVLFGITFVGPTAPFPLFGIVSSTSKGHLPLAYLFALVAMLLSAISYARMASAMPAAGSAYTYVRHTMHPLAGFLVGWTMLLDYALLPLISVIYLSLTAGRLLPFVPHPVWLLLFSAAITLINLFGLKVTIRANFLMTAIMSFSVVWFIVAAMRAIQNGVGAGILLSSKPFFDPATFSLPSVMAGTSIAAFSFLGFDGVSTLAEDSHDPKTNIGLATILVCVICGALFILQTYIGQLAWPNYRTYPNKETAFLDVARLVGGENLLLMVSFVLLLAGFASATTGQASASRLLFGMGRDRLLAAKLFAYLHPRYSTPTYSILAMGLMTLAGGFFLSFQLAAEAVNFGALLGFVGVNLSVISHYFIKQRKRTGTGLLVNLILPTAGAFVCMYVFVNLSNVAKLIGVVWCAAGLVYAALRPQGLRKTPELTLPVG